MTQHKDKESLETMLARIDERVSYLPALIKRVNGHDRDIIVAKVLAVILVIILAIKYPVIAEAIARVMN